jgi:predicted amidohydrolase YtcJ
VAIRGNRIYRVGSNREIKRLRRRATTVIDAHGGSVLPGFSDASARLPVLDTVAGHASGSALSAPAAPAGAPASPKASSGAAIEGRAPSGAPSVASATPTTSGESASIVRDAIDGAHRLGVTGLNTIAESGELQAYEALRRDDLLPLRVVAALRVPLPVDAAAIDRLDAIRALHADDPIFRVDAVALKVAVPAPSAKSAFRRGRTPAAASPSGLPRDVRDSLVALDRRGWNVVLQVEDERGLAATLDSLDELMAAPAGASGPNAAASAPRSPAPAPSPASPVSPASPASAPTAAPARERRHRIELARPMALDVARIRALGVAVSLPLSAAWAPGSALMATASTSGATSPAPVALDAAQPARSAGAATERPLAGPAQADAGTSADTTTALLDPHAGIRLLMASESLADPRLGLQALLSGPEPLDADAATAPVSEASLAAAIDAYTSTAAWASSDERRRGTLARDMLADIVIFSADLFRLSSDKLLDAVVTITIFDGKVVYDRESEPVHTEQ